MADAPAPALGSGGDQHAGGGLPISLNRFRLSPLGQVSKCVECLYREIHMRIAGSNVTFDNVTITPEPASLSLLAMVGLAGGEKGSGTFSASFGCFFGLLRRRG